MPPISSARATAQMRGYVRSSLGRCGPTDASVCWYPRLGTFIHLHLKSSGWAGFSFGSSDRSCAKPPTSPVGPGPFLSRLRGSDNFLGKVDREMKKQRQGLWLGAVLALLAVSTGFAGCGGDTQSNSPMTDTTTGGGQGQAGQNAEVTTPAGGGDVTTGGGNSGGCRAAAGNAAAGAAGTAGNGGAAGAGGNVTPADGGNPIVDAARRRIAAATVSSVVRPALVAVPICSAIRPTTALAAVARASSAAPEASAEPAVLSQGAVSRCPVRQLRSSNASVLRRTKLHRRYVYRQRCCGHVRCLRRDRSSVLRRWWTGGGVCTAAGAGCVAVKVARAVSSAAAWDSSAAAVAGRWNLHGAG